MLSEKEGFLTEKQHKFFTENLTLYKNQNFLVSTNYFRLILQKTKKFLIRLCRGLFCSSPAGADHALS